MTASGQATETPESDKFYGVCGPNRDRQTRGTKADLAFARTLERRLREAEQTDDVTMTAFNKLHRQFLEVTEQFAEAIAQRDATKAKLTAAESTLSRQQQIAEGAQKDAEWAREFRRTQEDANKEGCLLISLRMTKGGQYHESRHVLTERELNGAEATNGQVVAAVAKLTFGRLMHYIDTAIAAREGK